MGTCRCLPLGTGLQGTLESSLNWCLPTHLEECSGVGALSEVLTLPLVGVLWAETGVLGQPLLRLGIFLNHPGNLSSYTSPGMFVSHSCKVCGHLPLPRR